MPYTLNPAFIGVQLLECDFKVSKYLRSMDRNDSPIW